MLTIQDIRNKLIEKGLKITPQRMAVFDAIIRLRNHPTAENIITIIRKNHPNIATGTVYKVLDALVKNQLIKKVETENGILRYDAVTESHHHLYCAESDRIEDYFNEDLNKLLENYFKTNGIPEFDIEEIKLQIIGKFKSDKSNI